MRLLLTGASSFTGMWFAEALAEAGHEVVALARAETYADPLRRARVDRIARSAKVVYGAPFGGPAFLDAIRRCGPFDVFCHHGAEAAGHNNPDFDVQAAVAANTHNAAATLGALAAAGVNRVALTGSVFEGDEGRGDEPRLPFSPYGRSKTLTSQMFQTAVADLGMAFVKFVIPNPFGPYEAQTFQRHVMTAWSQGRGAHVSHPFYDRDNVPAGLLARAYVAAVEGRLGEHVSPSFYAGPVGDFFRRMARETGPRTGWACDLSFAESQSFEEPRVRLNTQTLNPSDYGWSEARFWDDYAAYYAG